MRYSYSALATYLKCPRMFEAKYILRSYPYEPPTPPLIRGKVVHEGLETALRDGVDPPKDCWLPDGLLPALRLGNARAEVMFETHEPAHVIGYLDVLLATDDKAHVIDWKTGKMKSPDPLQADVYAMLIRRKLGIEDVTFTWVGVDARRTVSTEPDQHAEARVMEIIQDIETSTDYPPIESWACRYCALTSCRYNPGG